MRARNSRTRSRPSALCSSSSLNPRSSACISIERSRKPLKPAPRVGVGERVVEEPHELVEALLEQRGDQVVAVAEAAVGGADADAGAAGDLVHRRVEPALGEHVARRSEQAGAVAGRVGAQGTLDR